MTTLLIDQVLADLDRVVERAWEERDRVGYFAALYRRVTRKVKEGIETPGVFEDPERMDRLDFAFASRYLDALDTWQQGGRPTASWRVALDASRSWRPIALQQLVVGINAHINLDLGIAAARVSPGAALPSLYEDFQRINQILGGLIQLVEHQLGEVSPSLGLLFRLAGHDGSRAVEFSLTVARIEAWHLAGALAPVPPADQEPLIAHRDREIARLARTVLHPGPLIDLVNVWVRLRESRDVRRVIEVLSEEQAHVTELVAPDAGQAAVAPPAHETP